MTHKKAKSAPAKPVAEPSPVEVDTYLVWRLVLDSEEPIQPDDLEAILDQMCETGEAHLNRVEPFKSTSGISWRYYFSYAVQAVDMIRIPPDLDRLNDAGLLTATGVELHEHAVSESVLGDALDPDMVYVEPRVCRHCGETT
jgi:hypothetical protein